MRIVMEGGGCRSAYSSGILDVLAQSGVEVGSIVGSSSGSMNSAFFAAGQTENLVKLWTDQRIVRRMVSIPRFFNPFASPGLDVDHLVDVQLRAEGALDAERATTSKTSFHTVAIDVENMRPVVHKPTKNSIWPWLKASMAMPLAYNRLVNIDGLDYVDTGVLDPVPYKTEGLPPNDGPLVVILTRRAEVRKAAPPFWAKWLLRQVTHPKVAAASLVQHEYHNSLMEELVAGHEAGRLILVEPPRDMPISRLTTSADKLIKGQQMGREVGEDLLRSLEKFL